MTSQVHIVFLYHPAADSRTSSLPDAIVKRVESLYQASNCTTSVAHIRYGCLPLAARDAASEKKSNLERFLSSSSSLSLTPFVTSTDYWRQSQILAQDVTPSILMNVINEIKLPRSDSSQDDLDRMMEAIEAKRRVWQGCLADGLVAALELFSRATPLTTPTLARYLVHILPDTPPLDMDDRSFPHSNLDSTHDRWSWIRAAQELGKLAVWPCTHVLPSTPGGTSSSLTPECEKVHECILDEMPSIYPSTSDPPSILGGHYTGTSNAHSLLLCGLGEAAASSARASSENSSLNRKRSRKVSASAKSQKDKTRQGDEKITPSEQTSLPGYPTNIDGQGAGLGRGEIDKIAMNKILFLQQQQQLMMRNLAIAARQQQTKEHDREWPARQRLLEHFRDQMIAQQAALKAQAAVLHSGGSVPNLSNSLTTLMNIDKEARDRGLNLGGPSGMQQAMVQRQKQLMHIQQQEQQQQLQNKAQLSGASSTGSENPNSSIILPDTSASAVSTGATTSMGGQQLSSAGGPQSFWQGAIMWTVALPGNKRNQAVTFVSAHCAPNTSKDNLMLPWQQRLNISEVQIITLSALQSYAARERTPCVLFQPLNVPAPPRPDASGNVAAPAPQQTNEAMYLMLAKMIDSKKSCAYIPLQGVNCTAEAGLVLVPTPTQAGSNNRRLLGLIFKQKVPWHLFASSPASATQTQGSIVPPFAQQQQQQVPQISPFSATAATGSNASSSEALSAMFAPSNVQTQQAALFQPQQQQQTSQMNIAPASFNPQLPSWAQPNAQTTLPTATATSNTFASVPLQSFAAAPQTNLAFDLSSLSNQFNFNTNQSQLNQQSIPQQQQQAPTFNPTTLNNLFAMQGNTGDQSQQSSTSQPAPLDLDALQRLLGLNQS